MILIALMLRRQIALSSGCGPGSWVGDGSSPATAGNTTDWAPMILLPPMG